MTKYSTYLVASFFENGSELFEVGYVSEDQAVLEIEAFIEDQYETADNVSYRVEANNNTGV